MVASERLNANGGTTCSRLFSVAMEGGGLLYHLHESMWSELWSLIQQLGIE